MEIEKRDLDFTKWDATLLLAGQLEALFNTVPELQNARIEELLRIVPKKRAVMRGTLNQRDVVFRIHIGQSEDIATREWNEYQRIWPAMSTGAYTVCEPILLVREHNILILEAVKGKPFQNILRKSKGDERVNHFQSAAHWLKAYIDVSLNDEPVGHRRWLQRAKKIYASQNSTPFTSTKEKILIELDRLATYLDGTTWRTAIGHGDFHPNNLIYRAGELTGIDIGGSARRPIHQDIARFLSHLARRHYGSDEIRHFGVSKPGFEAFSNVFGLTQLEREIALPFMIGCDALIRPGPANQEGRKARGFDAFCNAVLQDLTQIQN